jgi:hypothetical protein
MKPHASAQLPKPGSQHRTQTIHSLLDIAGGLNFYKLAYGFNDLRLLLAKMTELIGGIQHAHVGCVR